ncbi:MAG TPA: KGG domain-containing protein [Candidatus Saccharimonas sp.]|nr:KGG domain-containing protein [Candidatus Saccharimonas sp.]
MADNDTSMSTSEAGRRGGKAQGKENNPGNFANDREKASAAGREGAANQPIEAKKKGGEHSHSGGRKAA